MTLDVGVNLLWLAPGRVGGSEEYLVRQLTGLAELGTDAGVAPVVYCQPTFVDAHPELARQFDIATVPVGRDWRGLRLVAEHSWLAAKTRGHDVVHHGGGTVPRVGGGPVVLTVHDLQYRRFPEYFSAARRRYLDLMMPSSVHRAAVVATPSEYVRGTVIEAFDVHPNKVVVVPHGIPDVVAPDADEVASVRSRYGLEDQPYVVYPAITHPHKGHLVVIEMMQRLDDVALVLVGGAGAHEPAVRSAIEASGLGRRILRTGRVPARDRDVLLADADVLVFPSEYEGFGAPVVEAMALDTPVVCSAAPAVREVVGEAAVVVAEASGDAWAAAVVDARGRREQLLAAGRVRRADFTLPASGAAIASAYRSATAS